MKKLSIFKKTGRAVLALLALSGIFYMPAFAQNESEGLSGAAENAISFETRPVSIVSSSPAVTEILFYIGAGSSVKGVTTLCDYPQEAKSVQKIGDLNINYEKLLEIKPDVVFSMKGLRAKEEEILNSFGVRNVSLDLGSIESIFDSIDKAAELLKAPRNSSQLRKKMKNLSSLIRKKQKNIVRSVYFEIWGDPPMTVGGASFINQIINAAQGVNIFNEVNLDNLSVSLEKVIENNPEFIVAAYDAKTEEIALRPGFSNLIAVKDSNIIKIDYNIYVRPGPRVIEAVLDLYNRLYPDGRIEAEEITPAE
ncbi:MAG TPA: helical backbone metal receptor [Candidatus Wallbacteria bacterium]|nr:helical backbone metal receptor [Candidatus Wallbacteria bacterium]